MAVHSSTCAVVIPLFMLLIKPSAQICVSQQNPVISYCDSLQDLYQNNNSISELHLISNSRPNNNLEKLKQVAIDGSKSVERLEITGFINSIDHDAFDNFDSLRYLTLSYNKLEEIPVDFIKKTKLKYLSISYCNVTNIAPGAFVSLIQLENIRITYNNLTKIEQGIFSNTPISRLALSENQISQVDKFAFGNMTNLTNLLLDHNRLSKFIAQEVITYPNKLQKLWLQNNQLTEITGYMLEGLTNLRVLNLGFNEILSIEPKTFEETPKLVTLVLTHNALKIVSGAILPSTGLNELTVLYLDHNKLTYLSSSFLFKLNRLKSMSIGGNPWQCPCLDLVLRWLDDNNVKLKCDKIYLDGSRPICVVPDRKNICEYSYNEKYFQRFQASNSLYPKQQFCIL